MIAKLIYTCLILFLLCSWAIAFEGKVVSIADGDTLTVLTADKQQIKVRLSGIDTPERAQAFGTKAKQALSAKVYGKMVTVNDNGQDRYKRTLADVYHAGQRINLEMVQEGWAFKEIGKSSSARFAVRCG